MFLYPLKRGNFNDENNFRGIINIFLWAINLLNDRFTLILNRESRKVTIDDIRLDEIEEHFEVAVARRAGTPLIADAPA